MSEKLSAAVGREASAELAGALRKIEHCVAQLSDEQLWWRSSPSMNSIGNLMLHLCGNVGQWIVAGLSGSEDTRRRQQEFDEQGPIPKADLLRQINDTVQAASDVLGTLSEETLLATRRIQGFDVTGLQAIFESVAHFRGHTQEIVHLTRMQLGDQYQFAFVPQSAEQGAPVE